MRISIENIKDLLKVMGYLPEDGVDNIYYKKYSQHNNYIVRVNFNTQKIEYRESDIKTENGIRWGDLTTSNFENSENFVVLECINRLLEKGVNVNIKMFKKWKIKMYSFPTFIPQLVPLYRLAFL